MDDKEKINSIIDDNFQWIKPNNDIDPEFLEDFYCRNQRAFRKNRSCSSKFR